MLKKNCFPEILPHQALGFKSEVTQQYSAVTPGCYALLSIHVHDSVLLLQFVRVWTSLKALVSLEFDGSLLFYLNVHFFVNSWMLAFFSHCHICTVLNKYIAPELFLLFMTSLFTFYRCLLSAVIFCLCIIIFLLVVLLLTLYTPEVR